MADTESPAFPGDTDLAAQALNAVRAGADPEAVRKMFLEEAAKRGADPSKLTTDFINDSPVADAPSAAVDKTTKKQYADIISGEKPWDINISSNRLERQDVGLKGLIAPTIQKNSPVGGNFGNVKSDSETTAPRDWGDEATYAIEGGIKRGIGGLIGLAAPLAGDQASMDEAFEASKKLRDFANEDLSKAIDRTSNGVGKGSASVTGSVVSGLLPTTMLGEQMNAGMDKLDEGKSLLEAEGASAKTGLMNELMLGAGKLGIQKSGFLPYTTRAAAQVGTNVGLTAADKALEGEDITTQDLALAAGMGLGGALFHEGKAGGKKAPKTGDAAFDAGVEHAQRATGDIDFSHDEAIPAPAPTKEAKARERDEIKARADALGVSVKEYKEATGYSEDKPAAPVKPLADQLKEAESRRSVLDDDNLTLVAPASFKEPDTISESDLTPAERDSFERQQRTTPASNNGSGESAASLEAQSRVRDEKEAGQYRVLIDRDGTVTPLQGVDAVDTHARKGQIVAQRGVGKNEWTILSHGDDVSRNVANGKVNAAQPQLAALVEDNKSSKPTIHNPIKTTRGEILKRPGYYEDELGYIYDNKDQVVAQPKETLRPRTREEIEQHIAPTAQRALKQQGHDAINRAGNVHNVLDMLAKGKDDIAVLARKVMEHNDLRNEKITAVNPEDLLTSRNGNAQTLAAHKQGHILGLRGLHGEGIFIRGAGFKTNGLDRVTIMHEILHAALQDKIRAAAEGKIHNPKVVQAVHELENMRDALHKMDSANPKRPAMFDHAMTNIDELTSIAGTDPGMRAYLKGKTLGEVSAWSKLKDIWRTIIGAERMNKPAFDHVMEHINTLVEYHHRGKGLAHETARSVAPGSKENFARWFGKSVVKDEAGNPKTLYHGTSKDMDFNSFKVGTRGVWLTENPKVASDYASDNESRGPKFQHDGSIKDTHTADRVMPVHARIENPYKITRADHERMNVDNYARAQGQFFDELRSKGYDGVDMGDGNWVVLKDANQIKSATGNTGEYGDTKDIRYNIAPSEKDELQKPRPMWWAGVKEAAASGGIEPKVAAAEQSKQGLIAEGDAESVQSANRLGSVITKANKDLVGRAIAGDINAFKQLDAVTKEVVRDEYKHNFDRSVEIVKEIAANPHATPEMKAIGAKILENAGKYQMDVYTANAMPRSMKDKYKLANKAKAKLADNKPISAAEREALNSTDVARKFLEQYYMPSPANLKKMKAPHLEELYHYYTGEHADDMLTGMTKEERRTELEGAITKGMRDTVNRSGEVENILKHAMGLTDKGSSLRVYFNNMRAGSDIYQVKTKVPEALKQLWEPVLDPVARNVASIRQQYNYIANLRSQNMLARDGMGSIFTKERGHPTHNASIEGKKMGALQGLYTTPDVKRAIDSIFQLNAMTGDALDSLVASKTGTEFLLNRIKYLADKVVAPAASFTKLMSVVGNAGNYANNFVGSAAQIMANGNINPVAMAKGMRDAAAMIALGLKKNMSDSVRDLFRYRIAEYSHIAELQGSENRNLVASILKRSAEAANPLQALQQELSKMADGGRHAAAVVKEVYGAMDFWTKAANWHNELGFWKDHFEKTGQQMSEDQLKQFVAKRVNATNITPSAAGKLFKGLERYGVTRFGTYYAEVARTLKNNGLIGAQDFRDGIQMMASGNKVEGGKLALHGLKRVAGVGISIFAHNQHFALMAKGIASAAGLVATQMDDDDPLKEYMKKDNFLGSMDPLLISDSAHPEDGTFVYDLSHADPFGPITMPIKTAYSALSNMAEGKTKEAKADLDQFLNQTKGLYLSNALWGQVAKQLNGSRTRLEQENKPLYDKLAKMVTDAGFEVKGANRAINAGESILPRTVTNIVTALSPDIVSNKLKAAVAAGVGVSRLDVANDISNYMGGKALTDIKAAKDTYATLMKQDYTSSPERIEKSFVKGIKEAAEPYNKMRTAVLAAKRMGTDDIELMRRLKAAGMSKNMSYKLLNNEPISVGVLTTDLKRDFQRDQIASIHDEGKQEEALNRFIYNNEQLYDLMSKYSDKNIEELQ